MGLGAHLLGLSLYLGLSLTHQFLKRAWTEIPKEVLRAAAESFLTRLKLSSLMVATLNMSKKNLVHSRWVLHEKNALASNLL